VRDGSAPPPCSNTVCVHGTGVGVGTATVAVEGLFPPQPPRHTDNTTSALASAPPVLDLRRKLSQIELPNAASLGEPLSPISAIEQLPTGGRSLACARLTCRGRLRVEPALTQAASCLKRGGRQAGRGALGSRGDPPPFNPLPAGHS